jgi:hypothetical protein
MPSATFTAAQSVIRQELAPPPGATAVIIHFTVTPPPGATGTARLVHLRTLNSVLHPTLLSEGRLPRESEIAELIVRNNTLTAGFSGMGGKNAKHPVIHMGGLPGGSFPVTITVPFTGRAAVVAAGSLVATSDTDIAPNGQGLELLLGMEPIFGADLQPPVGWTISWDDAAVEWPGAGQTPPVLPSPAPPVQPPTPPVITPPTQPPVTPLPGTDPRAAALAFGLQLLLPQLPPQEAAILQPIIQTVLAGGQLNTQTILLAFLPLLLGGK